MLLQKQVQSWSKTKFQVVYNAVVMALMCVTLLCVYDIPKPDNMKFWLISISAQIVVPVYLLKVRHRK